MELGGGALQHSGARLSVFVFDVEPIAVRRRERAVIHSVNHCARIRELTQNLAMNLLDQHGFAQHAASDCSLVGHDNAGEPVFSESPYRGAAVGREPHL